MPPKRGNAKKAEAVVASDAAPEIAVDAPSKKRGGKAAVKAVEEKPEVEVKEDVKNGDEEPAKNGNSKRGRKAKEIGNGDAEVPAESPKSDEEQKVPSKRGRKAKDPVAEKQPASKKAKAVEEDAESDANSEEAPKAEDGEESEPEVVAKPKRGRKAAEKKEPAPKAAKNTKAKKGKEAEVEEPAADDDDEVAEEEDYKPSAKRGRAAAKKAPVKDDSEEEEAVEKVPTKKGRGANKAKKEPVDKKEPAAKRKATAKPLQNKATTDYTSTDFSCSKTTQSGKLWNFKISSWNVDGIRAWATKGGLEYIQHEKPDILCLQETKCSQDKLPSEVASIPGYHPYWLSGEQEGYAGVGIYTKKMAITVTYGLGDPSLDDEGRIITAEYEQFYLICTYVPNSGRGLVTLPKRLKWNEVFQAYVKTLDAKKPVIICGDMNVSHLEIDLTNPKTNKKNAGFTKEERDGMTELLGQGFVDTFRSLYPEQTDSYTFWTYMMNCRAKNVGWRLDYAIVSERLVPSICENVIRSQVFGSDHCPITLFMHLNGLEKLSEEN